MLGVAVPMTVHMVDTCPIALVLEDVELIDISVTRNQRSLRRGFGERFGFVD